MTTFIKRIFIHPFRYSLIFGAAKNNTKTSTSHIKQVLRGVIQDCGDSQGNRIQFKLNQAKTHADLWALRSDLHQLVARVHGERLAAERINGLVTLFEGQIPNSHLTRIRLGFARPGHS